MRIGLDDDTKEKMRMILSQKESNYLRTKRAKMDKSQFKKIKTIGLGAFGEVTLVKKIDPALTTLYAMKKLKKVEVLKRNQVAHVKAERDILAEADNEWVVKLYYSFQVSNLNVCNLKYFFPPIKCVPLTCLTAGPGQPLLHHGLHPWRRPHVPPHQVRHLPGGPCSVSLASLHPSP